MKATDLAPSIWNALFDQIERSKTAREIYFAKVTKADKTRKLIWVQDFGDLPIPLIGHNFSFSHYDTQANGTLKKREDKTQTNPTYLVEVVTPKVGQMAVILDPWGAKRYPVCIGVILSKSGYWEE